MSCISYVESVNSDHLNYHKVVKKLFTLEAGQESSVQYFDVTVEKYPKTPDLWIHPCNLSSNKFEYVTYKDLKKKLWSDLFPEEEIIEPYEGAVDDYEGLLGRLLPEDIELNIEDELDDINA